MKQKKVLQYILFLALIGGAFLCATAWADTTSEGGSIFQNAFNKLYNETFQDVRKIVYALAGFGLIGVATGGIMGKINWTWLASLTGALAILALAENYIAAATDDSDSMESSIVITGSKDFDLSDLNKTGSSLNYNDL